MIPVLAPLFQNDWASVGETLALHDGARAHSGHRTLPLRELVDRPSRLHELLSLHAGHVGVPASDATRVQWRAVASDWSLVYLRTLLPTIVAGATVLRHVFPVSLDDMAMEMDETGRPLRFFVADEGRHMDQADTRARFDTLLWTHLAPLFEALSRQTHLAPRILWSNAARRLESVFEEVLALTDHDPAVAEDRDRLLQDRHWQDRANPLYGRQRRTQVIEEGRLVTGQLHRACCLCYLLPDQPYCGACPLNPEKRKPPRRRTAATEQTPG